MKDVVIFKDRTFNEGADLCLKHRLFISGWLLSRTLVHYCTRQDHGAKLAVAFNSAQAPVALVLQEPYDSVMAFCRVDHRRQGYASACLKKLKVSKSTRAEVGIDGSDKFWENNRIECGTSD